MGVKIVVAGVLLDRHVVDHRLVKTQHCRSRNQKRKTTLLELQIQIEVQVQNQVHVKNE